MIIWALTDDRIGNSKQTLALAAALGKFAEQKITFSKITQRARFNLPPETPDIIISAGRKLSHVAVTLKKKYKCKAIHIMYPPKKLAKKFDFIITPRHDNITNAANIIKTTGSICAPKKLPAKTLTKPMQVAVLIGNISPQEAADLVIALNKNTAIYSITTSRRTQKAAITVLEANLRQVHQIYKFGSAAPNPYDSFLENADAIIVSGDSANMITEAAHTGRPVYILEVKTKPKFNQLWQDLYALGIARPLAQSLETWEYQPLDNLASCKLQLSSLY